MRRDVLAATSVQVSWVSKQKKRLLLRNQLLTVNDLTYYKPVLWLNYKCVAKPSK